MFWVESPKSEGEFEDLTILLSVSEASWPALGLRNGLFVLLSDWLNCGVFPPKNELPAGFAASAGAVVELLEKNVDVGLTAFSGAVFTGVSFMKAVFKESCFSF